MAEKLQLTPEKVDAIGSDVISESYRNADKMLETYNVEQDSCVNCYYGCVCVCECLNKHHD